MALTITYAPVDLVGDHPLHVFYDNNVFKLSTDNPDAKLISCEILSQPSNAVLAQQYSHVLDGNSVFNLRGVLSSLHSLYNNFITEPATLPTPGNIILVDTPKHSSGIKLRFSEFNTANELVNPITTEYYRLLKAGVNEYEDRWGYNDTNKTMFGFAYPDSATDLVTRYAFKNQLIPIVTIGPYVPDTMMQLRLNGSNLGAEYDTHPTCYNLHLLRDGGSVTNNTLGMEYNEEQGMAILHHVQSTSLKFYTKPKPCRGGTLYFLNPWGGWEWFNYVDFVESTKVNKSDYEVYDEAFFGSKSHYKYISKDRTEKKLYSEYRDGKNTYYLKYLITSPIVIDDLGNTVKVIDSSIRTNINELIDPTVTIEYNTPNIINY